MQLLFFHAEFYEDGKPAQYRGFQKFSLNFSRDRFFWVEDNVVQEKKREVEVPDDFWENGIYNVTALVGENASGKTTILQYMAKILAALVGISSMETELEREALSGRNKLVLEDEDSKKTYEIDLDWGNGRARIAQNAVWDREAQVEIPFGQIKDKLAAWKLVYQSNTLTLADMEFAERVSRYSDDRGDRSGCRKRHLYNMSATAWLLRQHHAGEERTAARFSPGALLAQYFEEEQYRQVKLVFDRKQNQTLKELKAENIPVPYARQLTVRFQKISDEEESGCRSLFPQAAAYIKRRRQGNEIELLVWQLSSRMVLNYLRTLSVLTAESQSQYRIYFELIRQLSKPSKDWKEEKFEPEEFIEQLDAAFELIKQALPQENKEDAERERKTSKDFIRFVFGTTGQGDSERYKLEQYVHVKKKIYWMQEEDLYQEIEAFYIETEWAREDRHPFIEFLKNYRYACDFSYFLDFSWGLSSGENAMLSLFADLYYLYGEDYANHTEQDYALYNGKTKCDSLLLFMDEADMLYHPEWQRKFLAGLTAYITRLYPKEVCSSIQVIMTTHSPLMLGDMPSQNVLYLKREKDGNKVEPSSERQTFAQNIYLLLKDSFYLNQGTLGEIAQTKLKKALEEIEKIKELNSKETDAETIQQHMRTLGLIRRGTLDLLAPGLIKSKLREEIEECEAKLAVTERKRYSELSVEELRKLSAQIEDELERRGANDTTSEIYK